VSKCPLSLSMWAGGQKVATGLEAAERAATVWAECNSVAFGQGKTRQFSSIRGGLPNGYDPNIWRSDAPVQQRGYPVARNLARCSAVADHGVVEKGRYATDRLRRVAGQMRLPPSNCRKAMTACVQLHGIQLGREGAEK
jgi:hypothetical protein